MSTLTPRTCKFCGADISERHPRAIICEREECLRRRDNKYSERESKQLTQVEPAVRQYLDEIASGERPSQLITRWDRWRGRQLRQWDLQ